MKSYVLLLFCLVLMSANCRATPNPDDNNLTNNLLKVTKKWVELLDDGKLPGMTKEDHGNTSVFRLTKSVKKDYFDRGILNKNMYSDIKDISDPYILYVETKDDKHFKYFFSLVDGKASLISSYEYEKIGWAKIEK